MKPLVARINAFEQECQKLSEQALRDKTAAWKKELSAIQDGEQLAQRLSEGAGGARKIGMEHIWKITVHTRQALIGGRKWAHVWQTGAAGDLPQISGESLENLPGRIVVREVAAASAEQAASVVQINRAMASVDQVTQRNASAAEELSSTAAEMTSQADGLQAIIGFFKGADARPAAPLAAHTPPRAPRPRVEARA